MKPIKLVVAALAFAAPVAVPAFASAAASSSHLVLRDQNLFTEFYWKADPTTACGPEAHVIGFGGYETSQTGGGAPTATTVAAVTIEYFDPCTGVSETTGGFTDQGVSLNFRGLNGRETATIYPFVCDINGNCGPDLANPIGINLSVAGATPTHDHLAGSGHTPYYQFSFEFNGAAHFGPVSGSVTFTTSAGDVLTVFPNYTDPQRPLITGAGAGGAVDTAQQTDLFVSFGN